MDVFLRFIEIAIGIMFTYYGIHKLSIGFPAKKSFFDTIGFKPGALFALLFGLIEFATGLALIIHYFVVPAYAVVMAIMLVCIYIKYTSPKLLGSSLLAYILMFVGSILLLIF